MIQSICCSKTQTTIPGPRAIKAGHIASSILRIYNILFGGYLTGDGQVFTIPRSENGCIALQSAFEPVLLVLLKSLLLSMETTAKERTSTHSDDTRHENRKNIFD